MQDDNEFEIVQEGGPLLNADEERELEAIHGALDVDRIPRRRPPTTETEMNEFISRDRVRRAGHVAISTFVKRVFDTSPNRTLSLNALWNEVRKAVDPVVEQYRTEELARYLERLSKHQGELGGGVDIADLTCEDP